MEYGYLPIEDYGVIGDLHTAALVGKNGSIDWCCFPHFDSPSVFAAILDEKKGGRWQIASAHPGTRKQLYFPDTNVLITRFLGEQGVGEVVDCMPVEENLLHLQHARYHQIVRQVTAIRGEITFRLVCEPAFDYGRVEHMTHLNDQGAVFASSVLSIGLVSPVPLSRTSMGVAAEFTLKPGESVSFVLRQAESADDRFTWIRDASFTVYAFMRIGFTEEAGRFMEWLEARIHEERDTGRLQIMYGINGEHSLTETALPHFEGYRGSGPVRIGNGAYDQLQLDIYGEMMDSVYLYNKYGSPISHDMWKCLVRILEWMRMNWKSADKGIWEMRSANSQNTHSKVMCWVALDRALRLSAKRSLPLDRIAWEATRDEIFETIMEKAWDPKRKSFVQSLGSNILDASALLMPLMKFISPTDPRMLSTLDAIRSELEVDSLVYRYRTGDYEDGLNGEEGTFSMCTFWLVECLARAGRTDEARLVFEKMLSYANHLGLFAEEVGKSGEALGNFPQAFTHLGLISAAYNLDQALG